MSDRLLTTREVADRLAVSPETVLRWHRSGRLPGGRRLSANVLRFEGRVLERWLSGRGTPGVASRDAILADAPKSTP